MSIKRFVLSKMRVSEKSREEFQVLSHHSEYFDTLFNGGFKEKCMSEILIEDVKYEDFAALLSLIQDNPIFPTGTFNETLEFLFRFSRK